MRLLDLTLATPVENLALDEALLLDAEAGTGGEVLRFWESPTYVVVLGSGGRVADDVNLANCKADGVPMVRRCSGGGTVLLGPGCLCYTLVLAMTRPGLADVRRSYSVILERIAQALPLRASHAGSSDLASDSRKISGNAQRRLRAYLLHHGTLLHHFDVEMMERYLRLPPKRPEYRDERPHARFVMNLDVSPESLRKGVATAWQAVANDDAWPRATVERLVREKYERSEWTLRL